MDNPTGCDVRKTYTGVLLTVIAMMAAMTFGEHLAKLPPIAKLSHSGTVHLSKEITLNCYVGDTPFPSVSWYHNGDLLAAQTCSKSTESDYCMGDGDRDLTISRVRDYTGKVWCVAKNSYGTAVSDKVLLEKSDLRDYRGGRPQTVSVKEHDKIFLKAHHTFKNGPFGKIRWGPTDDRYIVTSTGELFITDVLWEDTEKTFGCRYYTKDRSYSCGKKRLNVTRLENRKNRIGCVDCGEESLLHSLEGDGMTLDCLIYGSPKPNLRWTHNGQELEEKGHQLNLINVTEGQGGHYQCIGENTLGQKIKEYRVNIATRPIVIEEPRDVVLSIDQLKENQVEFNCVGTGSPQPKPQWYIDDMKITENRQLHHFRVATDDKTGTLRISHMTANVSGTIHCNLSNANGYQWFQARLSITGKITTPLPFQSPTTSTTKRTTTPTPTTTTTTTTTKTTLSSSTTTMTETSSTERQKPTPPNTTPVQATIINNEPDDTKPTESPRQDQNTGIVLKLEWKVVMIAISVLGFILLVVTAFCTILCYRACQRRRPADEQPQYPRSVSNLSYISHLHNIRDFDDRASEDSGIDERSHMKSKMSIPRSENIENQKNEFDEMIIHEDVV